MTILTSQELADYLGVEERTVRRHANIGTIPAKRLGRNWKFVKEKIDEWLIETPEYADPRRDSKKRRAS